MKHSIEFVDTPDGVDEASLVEMATSVLNELLKEPAEVTIAFIEDDDMAALNKQFRDIDAPTDVLSFPIEEDFSEAGNYLGDIAIAVQTAKRQSIEMDHDLHTELAQLITHGLIHLCGYDHENDNGEMDNLELKLRDEITTKYCPED